MLSLLLASLISIQTPEGRPGFVCDAGTVPKGAPLILELTFENQSTAPVTVKHFEGTCSPQFVPWLKLESGERRTVIAVSIETRNFSGPVMRSQSLEFLGDGEGTILVEANYCGQREHLETDRMK